MVFMKKKLLTSAKDGVNQSLQIPIRQLADKFQNPKFKPSGC
ncbi:hypothetical protein NC99_40190 [Sunxiuqinia dokdonensis]|uniref:Uncharacterized protein n=1 Tax=Sunxiuqinia dokdonensis TaxID=1409788 RepID=A0A0L8V3Y8_9BACT|nr:hypothetical protein NC99_40190 [Sunxiuqinia dokdonensis]